RNASKNEGASIMTTWDDNSVSRRKRSIGTALAAMFWAVESSLVPLTSAWAQTKSAEPEANPQFQQDVQSAPASNAGQPIDNAQGPVTSGVQVGATEERKPTMTVSSDPLDVRVSIRVRDA